MQVWSIRCCKTHVFFAVFVLMGLRALGRRHLARDTPHSAQICGRQRYRRYTSIQRGAGVTYGRAKGRVPSQVSPTHRYTPHTADALRDFTGKRRQQKIKMGGIHHIGSGLVIVGVRCQESGTRNGHRNYSRLRLCRALPVCLAWLHTRSRPACS